MVLVDSRIGSVELLPHIRKVGVPCESATLEYGDAAFEGNGPKGKISVGVERKTLHDMLNCIDSARYAAHQRPGMLAMYDKSFLIVEGVWRPHTDTGTLMEGFNGGSVYKECRYRSQRVMYSKLRRYLFSVALSGVVVLYSRDILQTAYDITELYHWFQKPWKSHQSLNEIQTIVLPSLGKPTLVRRVAAQITGVGVQLSLDAERLFKNTYTMINADEVAWMRLPNVGVRTAQQIVREIGTNATSL